MSVCRLCGDFKCFEELQDIYDSESDIILKLRNILKVELEYNKMLPNSVCLECVNNLENCNKFLELISAVQTRFEIELQQQLQMFECNYEVPNDSHEVELKNIEIKLEKLNPNKIKHSTANRRSTKQKNPQSTKENVSKKPNESKSESIASKPKQRRRIRVKKYTHIAENYQMANLFENELEGRFVVQPQDMDIGNHQKTEDGILPDEMLEKLKEISWKNYKWKCEECQEYFENVMDLEMHSLKLHKKRVVLDCCARTFRTYAKYLFHLTEKHQPDLKYCCLICSEYRTSFLHLYRHIESAHSNYKILICLYCGQFHYDCYMLFRHIDEKHVPLPLLYHCDLCGESFSRRDKIIRHMTLIHTKDKQIKQKTYMCEICASNFRNSYDLRNHQKSSHSNISEEVCSYCGKMYKSKMLLQRHLRRLHEYKGPSLTCEVCGKISITQAEHRRHVMVHTDELPYKCKFCSRKFKHRSGARYHTLSEHTGERPYHCPVENCDLTFIDHPNANKHIKTTHGLIGVKPVLVRKNK